jgi:hypothetical protein
VTEIFICPKGAIEPESVRLLVDHGVVVVQADDPKVCRFLRSGQEIDSRDLLWAAMKALMKPSDGN